MPWLAHHYQKSGAGRVADIILSWCCSMYSQLGQDGWVLQQFPKDHQGYFVEIGAHHPTDLSNTKLLEEHGWSGIAFDPFPVGDWRCRPRTTLLTETIAGVAGQVKFQKAGALGGIEGYQAQHLKDQFPEAFQDAETVELHAITPERALQKYKVPLQIDYLSLDTEGTELKILKAFPFERYEVRCITVEHNFEEPKRTDMRNLLESKGFTLEKQAAWEDWYYSFSF